MASIRNTFLKGVETIFSVFNEAVKTGTYNLEVDDGFDTPVLSTDLAVRCIFESAKEKDVELLTFSKLIQPQDIIGLVPFIDITLDMNTQGYFIFNTKRYQVVGHDLDPLGVIYTLLLRKN